TAPGGSASGNRNARSSALRPERRLGGVMPVDGYANPQLLVTPSSLHERIGTTGPLVIDFRPAEEFARGAIPGAVHLDLYGVSLIDTEPAPMRAFLWIIEHLLATRGVDADREVVVYDECFGIR